MKNDRLKTLGVIDWLSFLNRVYRSARKPSYFAFLKHYPRKIRRTTIRWKEIHNQNIVSFSKRCTVERDENDIPLDPYGLVSPACDIVGVIPDYIGSAVSRRIPVNSDFLKWFSESTYSGDVELRNQFLNKSRVHMSSSFDTQLPILREYAKPLEKEISADEYLTILEEEDFPFLQLPKLDFPNVDDLDKVLIKAESNPGFYTSKFFGSTKEASAPASLAAAKHVFETLKERLVPYQGLWSLAGRSKDVSLNKPNGTHVRTRAVWVPESFLVILGGVVVQRYTSELQRFDRNALFIGKNYHSSELDWLNDFDSYFDFLARCDWTLFDSHVSQSEILAALSLIRSSYPEGEHVDRYFLFIYGTMVYKNLVVPPGIVYRFKKGLPSGHPFTSLVGTLVNYMRQVVILRKIYGKGMVKYASKMVLAGDDTKYWLKWHKNLFRIDEIIKEINPSWECDSVAETIIPSQISAEQRKAYFLKREKFDGVLVGWSTVSMLNKLLYPKERNFGPIQQFRWFKNMVVTAPGNYYLNNIVKNYLIDLFKKKGNSDYAEYMRNMIEDSYKKCYFDGCKHQFDKDPLSVVLKGDYYIKDLKIDMAGKVLAGGACLSHSKLASYSSSVSVLSLLTILLGPKTIKNMLHGKIRIPRILEAKFDFNEVDIELVAKVIGYRHYGSVSSAIKDATGYLMNKVFKKSDYVSNHYVHYRNRLQKIITRSNEYSSDILGFARALTSKKERRSHDKGYP